MLMLQIDLELGFVFDDAYIKRKDYLCMLSILQRIKEEIWQKTHIRNRQHVINWIKMFTLYLHMKTDRIKPMKFLTQIS